MSLSKKYLLLLFFAPSLTTLSGQINKGEKKTDAITATDSSHKVAWLKRNAIQIRSIDSLDEDFSDLAPLKKMIGDADVVMIGEPNHHIGTVYLAKTRLVRFLHKEMGFNLLAFESGLYDVGKAWREIKNGASTRQAFKNSVFFADKEEYKPLINYIHKSVGSTNPLELIGFDNQMTGSYSSDSLVGDLRKFFNRLNYSLSCLNDSSYFARELRKAKNFSAPDKIVIDTLSKMIRAIDSITAKPYDFETGYYLQLLKSIKKDVQAKQLFTVVQSLSLTDQQRIWNLYVSMRDEQMAENLLWEIGQYPKRKIIVWAANTHIMTDYPGDKTKQLWNDKPDAPPAPFANWENTYMGIIIKDSIKEKVFTIITLGNGGTAGVINQKDPAKSFTFPIAQSVRSENLGNLLIAAGFKQGIVNLKNPPKGGEWLRGRFRVGDGQGFAGEWHKAADAILFIKDFTPTNIKD
jgi:erythromycin esterase